MDNIVLTYRFSGPVTTTDGLLNRPGVYFVERRVDSESSIILVQATESILLSGRIWLPETNKFDSESWLGLWVKYTCSDTSSVERAALATRVRLELAMHTHTLPNAVFV